MVKQKLGEIIEEANVVRVNALYNGTRFQITEATNRFNELQDAHKERYGVFYKLQKLNV